MGEFTKSTFEGGIQQDVDISISKPNTAVYLENIKIYSHENTDYIVSNLLGTVETSGALKVVKNSSNVVTSVYLAKGVKVSNDIAYIVSAEYGVDATGKILEATGRTEFGCYPSPDYLGQSGFITPDYKPFMNYKGDTDLFPDYNGPLNTDILKVNPIGRVEVEIQQEYDGSVNVIFADGVNPIMAINSRFSKIPGNRYQLIDRTGRVDANVYDKEDWNTILRLEKLPSTIAQVELVEVGTGGRIPAGNYTFYFKYEDKDGNGTRIFCQTFPISVFQGQVFSGGKSIKGGEVITDKKIKLQLSTLDETYTHVQVLIAHELDGTAKYSKLSDRIKKDSETHYLWTYTGNEALLTTSVAEIDIDIETLAVARSITQIQSRLIKANLKGTDFSDDNNRLRKFAALTIPKFKQIPIHCGHNSNDTEVDGLDTLPLDDKFEWNSEKNAWNIGYANPKNIYARRGYWGGETYSFAIRFVYPDFSFSSAFPTFGYDDIEGGVSVGRPFIESYVDNLIAEDNTGYSSTTTYNINGTYRFPSRVSSVSNGLVTSEGIQSYAVTFDIPSLDLEIDGKKLSSMVRGIEFLRSDRIKDCLFQATALSCYPFHSEVPGGNGTDAYIWNGASPARPKFDMVLPLVKGIVPTKVYEGSKPFPYRWTNYKSTFGEFPTRTPDRLDLTNASVVDYATCFGASLVGLPLLCLESFAVWDEHDLDGPYKKGDNSAESGQSPHPESAMSVHYGTSAKSNRSEIDQTIGTGSVFINRLSALYSPDILFDEGVVDSFINSGSLKLQKLGVQNCRAAVTLGEVRVDGTIYNGRPVIVKATSTSKGANLLTGFKDVDSMTSVSTSTRVGVFGSLVEQERFLSLPYSGGSIIGDTMRYFNTESLYVSPYVGVVSENILSDNYGYRALLPPYAQSHDIITPTGARHRFVVGVGQRGDNEGGFQLIDDGVQPYFDFFNLYRDSEIRDWETVKIIYKPIVLKYTPISQKMYLFKDIIKTNTVYDSSVPTTDVFFDDTFLKRNCLAKTATSLTNKPTFWGGDCYITPYVVKQIENVDGASCMYFSSFLESDFNTYLVGNSDNFPFIPSKLKNGNDPISRSFNAGFKQTIAKKFANALDFSAPFTKTAFDTRVAYSLPHAQNTFANAYTKFENGAYKDYSKHLGQIVKVVNVKNVLFMIQETGISTIPVNERSVVSEAIPTVGEKIIIGEPDILSQYIATYSERHGTQIQFACVATEDNLYVLDLSNFKFICMSGTRGLEYISDYKVGSYIKKFLSSFLGKQMDITKCDIVGHDFTSVNSEIVWTFYDKANTAKEKNISLAYNIQTKQFHTFYSMIPYNSFCLEGKQFVFNSEKEQNKIHQIECNLERNSIFGVQKESIIKFKVAERYEFEKVFDTIALYTNNVLPSSVVFYVDGGETTITPVHDPINIHLSNAKHREGVTYMNVPRIKTVTNQDVTKFLDAVKTNAAAQMGLEGRMRGKSLIIELHYNTTKQLKLNSVISQYRISNS